jgi:transposase InsO family protein
VNSHSRARTTPLSRAMLVDRIQRQGWTVARAAERASISVRTGYKWLARFKGEGPEALRDRRSVPGRIPRMTDASRTDLIVLLRRCRMSGPAIARSLKMPRSTVARVLEREGLGRGQPFKAAVVRYQRERPGELIHLDVKKLARIVRVGHRITGDRRDTVDGAGWEFVHVAIDDSSRIVYAEVLADEKGATCAAFLRRALAHYRRLGMAVEQLLTDNGTGYTSHVFRHTCCRENLKHLRTRPYRPCTNGKAERVIQTLLREWAYSRPYRRSRERTRALSVWLRYYNRWRPHGSLAGRPPLSRLDTPMNNVSGNYS